MIDAAAHPRERELWSSADGGLCRLVERDGHHLLLHRHVIVGNLSTDDLERLGRAAVREVVATHRPARAPKPAGPPATKPVGPSQTKPRRPRETKGADGAA